MFITPVFLKTATCTLHRLSSVNGKRLVQSTFNFSSRARRRRPVTGKFAKFMDDETQSEQQKQKTKFQVKDMLESSATGLFVPRNEHGEEVTMGEYLKFANLSPWVPVPDAVARRALDIGKANEEDIHYELGSGDGRVNFFAIDLYKVKKSVGIDIDPSMIDQSLHRIAKRHPRPENISFVCADLVDETNENTNENWKRISEECTLLTMYFVEEALDKLKPLLERHLLGMKCKVITIGYQINGWEPKWSEILLGLTINMYDMENVDELLNRSIGDVEVSPEDEELNRRSRQILAEQYGESEADNPFAQQRLKKSTVFVAEEDDDIDFDENEVFGDPEDEKIITRR